MVAPRGPPHLVILLVDDLGIGDTSLRIHKATSESPTEVVSPNMQQLRDQGLLLDQHYVFKFCSPSRSQLLTGRYAYHLGQQTPMNLNPNTKPCGLSTRYALLPQLLKKRGYWNAAIGKWHQGFFRPEYLPTMRGFDRFMGFYSGGIAHSTHVTPYAVEPNWWTPPANRTCPTHGCTSLWDWHNDSHVGGLSSASFARSTNGTYSSELIADHFEHVVDEYLRGNASDVNFPHRRGPFFGYVAFSGVHLPLEVPARYLHQYEKGAFGGDPDRLRLAGMVTAVDDAIGRVVRKLKVEGMYENSLILLMSDNGAPVCTQNIPPGERCKRHCGGSNGMLRGSKMTDWEGGVRGLGVVSGGVIPKNRRGGTYSGLLSQTDWYAAFASLAGVAPELLWSEASGPVPPDAVNGTWEALISDSPSPRKEVVHNIFGDEPGALRVGKYKLVRGDPLRAYSSRQYNSYNGWAGVDLNASISPCSDVPCLFNIERDPEERHDLSQQEPHVLARMVARYDELRGSEVSLERSGLCPAGLPSVDGCTSNRNSGLWSPWISNSFA